MKKTTQATFGIIGAALLGGATTASAEVEAMIGDSITGEISTGWDSQYFFRGLWFGDETAWTNVEFSKELATNLTGSVNLFYTEVLDNGAGAFAYSEANVGAALSYDAGFGTFDLGLLHYRFFDGFGGSTAGVKGALANANEDATELSLTYSQDIAWGVSASLMYAYDFRIDGQYAEFGLSKSWQLNDCVGLDLSVSTGYSLDDYYAANLGAGAEDDDFTHVLVSLALPVALTETSTLTPHVTANFSQDAREATNNANGQDDTEVYFGASFAVSF